MMRTVSEVRHGQSDWFAGRFRWCGVASIGKGFERCGLSYIWLGSAIIFSFLMTERALGVRQLIGGLLFAAGGTLIAYDGLEPGHVLALCGGLIWGWYVARIPFVEGSDLKASAITNTVVGACIITMAYIAGNRWDTSGNDLFWLVGLILAINLGNVAWTFGVKHGEPRKGKIVVLFLPVFAVCWMLALGVAVPSQTDIMAVIAITMAGLIASPHVFKREKTAKVISSADRELALGSR